MEVKVVKRFRDKHSGKIYEVNDIIDVTKKRLAEILEVAPLVEKVTETPETETPETETPETETPETETPEQE